MCFDRLRVPILWTYEVNKIKMGVFMHVDDDDDVEGTVI